MENNNNIFSIEEETRNGYHISTAMKKVWKEELDLLCELDRACKELGLRFFLDSGTLLGAIRDGHFIPWDDDIDVIMLREDYDILVHENKRMFQEPYFFQCVYTDIDYPRGHAQLRKKGTCAMIPYEATHVLFDQSIFIDIFVLDGIPDSTTELVKQFKQKQKIKRKMDIIGIPASTKPLNTIIKKMMRLVYKVFYPDISTLYSKYESICKKYSNTSMYIDKIMFREKSEGVYKLRRDSYRESIDVMFEGKMFPVPIGYDDVLRTFYGDDYLIPSKAPTTHGSLIFSTDKSYKEVLREMNK